MVLEKGHPIPYFVGLYLQCSIVHTTFKNNDIRFLTGYKKRNYSQQVYLGAVCWKQLKLILIKNVEKQ